MIDHFIINYNLIHDVIWLDVQTNFRSSIPTDHNLVILQLKINKLINNRKIINGKRNGNNNKKEEIIISKISYKINDKYRLNGITTYLNNNMLLTKNM